MTTEHVSKPPTARLLTAVGLSALGIAAFGGVCAVLAAVPSRVTYECMGEAPRACTCYRSGTLPPGFFPNRASMGPAAGVERNVLLVLAAGFFCVLVVVAFNWAARRDVANVVHPKLFAVVLVCGGVLLVTAFVLWIWRVNPAPCEDQGALGSAWRSLLGGSSDA